MAQPKSTTMWPYYKIVAIASPRMKLYQDDKTPQEIIDAMGTFLRRIHTDLFVEFKNLCDTFEVDCEQRYEQFDMVFRIRDTDIELFSVSLYEDIDEVQLIKEIEQEIKKCQLLGLIS